MMLRICEILEFAPAFNCYIHIILDAINLSEACKLGFKIATICHSDLDGINSLSYFVTMRKLHVLILASTCWLCMNAISVYFK